LMNSSGHRSNILHTSYGRIGVGIVRTPSKLVIVQVFTN
jgi:uncharacterized protein YkwD